MFTKIRNGEPVVFTHQCKEEDRGRQMTREELREFLVRVLFECFKETGSNVELWDRESSKSSYTPIPDMMKHDTLGPNSFSAEYVVLCSEEEKNDCDIAAMEQHFLDTGVISKIIVGNVWCLDTNGIGEICGGDYVIKFYSHSIIPNQPNTPHTTVLSQKELAEKVATAWMNLNADILEPYLISSFHYNSAWVFEDIASRYEYMFYLRGKFVTLRRNNVRLGIQLGKNSATGNFAVILTQGNVHSILTVDTYDGWITSIRMDEFVP